jgi:hypothetical protein
MGLRGIYELLMILMDVHGVYIQTKKHNWGGLTL